MFIVKEHISYTGKLIILSKTTRTVRHIPNYSTDVLNHTKKTYLANDKEKNMFEEQVQKRTNHVVKGTQYFKCY